MRSQAEASLRRATVGRHALGAAAILVLAAALLLASSPSAAQTRKYTGTSFGPDGVGGTESFGDLQAIAVDQSKNFVYAYDTSEGGKIFKFATNGEPAPFGSGASNVIEKVGGGGSGENELAVAPPGSPGGTSGDLYVVHNSSVQVFSEAGVELGALGASASCGVAVSPAGHLFIGTYSSTITEYVPSANPPTDADLVATGKVPVGLCNVAADGLNGIYAAHYSGGEIGKLDGIADTAPTVIRPAGPTLFADPESSELYADVGESIAVYDSTGAPAGAFGKGEISGSYGIAISDAAERAYVGDNLTTIKIFGPPLVVPDTKTEAAGELLPEGATLNGTVGPEGLAVQECKFEYGETEFEKTIPCEAPDASEISPTAESVPVHATVTDLSPEGTYRFRLVTANANGTSEGEPATLTTPGRVVTEPASVSAAGVVLNGKVDPSGGKVSACKFEYGLVGQPGFEGSSECDPAPGSIPTDSKFHPVTAKLEGLAKGALYRFRLVATTVKGVGAGQVLRFETFGSPGIREPRASGADQSSATLEATINPRGSAGTYAFQWGPTTAYGHVVAAEAAEPYGAAGLIVVRARVTGLAAASTYHFLVVATNAEGTSESGDGEFETLNSCGLPEGRCFELVSERESGPVAIPDGHSGRVELHHQAAVQAGAFAYSAEGGFADATKGSEVLYRAVRGPEGWVNTQLSAPLIVQNETAGGSAHSSVYQTLSETLSCGVLASNQPLTDDASTKYATETGGANLYRDNMNGTYTAISTIPPENPDAIDSDIGAFEIYGTSADCSSVLFTTNYKYPGVPAVGAAPLYEWDEGTLRSVGFIPGSPSGEVPAEVIPGFEPGGINARLKNLMSADGSRVFFTAPRQASTNPEEIGARALFVRENGQVTRDVSLSETATPDREARFQFATKDGSHVFFLANAGLTAESSSEGQDLYEYDFARGKLVDLSIDEEEHGAEAAGFIGSSLDGSRIYFVARGELVSGEGKSYTENVDDNTYSVYTEFGGEPAYVGSVRAGYPRITSQGNPSEEDQLARLFTGEVQSSQVSADGRYLLFESSAPNTGYEGGNGVAEAYLFDAAASSEPLVCVTCRQDGRPTVMPYGNEFLVEGFESNSLQAPRSLAVKNGEPEVFFTAFDPLAPGAVEGLASMYEWAHGQIFHLATEPPDLQSAEHPEGSIFPAVKAQGVSADGTDVYLATPQRLTWEDQDERFSIYDARVGGGFPEPAAPAPPCNPAAESSCQGAPASPSPAASAPPTKDFHGPGNLNPKKHQKKRHKSRHKKHHRNRRPSKRHRAGRKNSKGDKGHHKDASSDGRHGA